MLLFFGLTIRCQPSAISFQMSAELGALGVVGLAVALDEELAVFYKFMGYGFRFMIYMVNAF
jgi:hypothetical protein